MEFSIQGSRPIWQQLAEQLRQRIVTGEYPPGSRFPSVRELAAEAGVNPNTMQRAMAQLESDGLVITNRTAGRTVTDREDILAEIRTDLALERLEAYFRDLEALGFSRTEAAAMAGERGEDNGQ